MKKLTDVRTALVVVLAALMAAPAMAQNVRVSASVDAARIYVGDSVTYTITVHEAETQDQPVVEGIPGLLVEYRTSSTNTSMSIVNGRRSTSNTQNLQYLATPSRAGTFTIPPQEVVIGGQRYITNQVQVTAIEPPESDLSPLTVTPARTTVYVGEPVELHALWRIAEEVEGARFVTESSGGVELVAGPQPAQSRSTTGVRWDNDTLTGVLGTVTTPDGEVRTLNMKRWFIAGTPGEVTIGPVAAVYDVRTGRPSRSIFQQGQTERRITRSEPIRIRVLPLPGEGRPSGFDGLVGRYTAAASATPLRVRVGDPITLTYEVRSDGPLGRVGAPDLELEPGMSGAFKLDPEGWQEVNLNDASARRFTTTIRALDDSVSRVPPLGFAYFDTGTGAYERAESSPIPLMVDETRVVTLDDAVGGGDGFAFRAPEIARAELGDGPGGILANSVSPDAIVNQQTLLLTRFENPVWVVTFAAPPVGCFALLGALAIQRRRDPVGRRRAGAKRSALATLRSTGDAERAIRAYLSLRFDRNGEAITEADCLALLGPVDQEAAEELAGAMLSGAAPRYGEPASEPPSTTRVAELLRAVDREGSR